MKRTIIAASLVLASISAAHAAAITGLYNTGLGASGTADTHYSLSAASSDTTITATAPTITYDGPWPTDGTWLVNNDTSRWITPTATQGQTFDAPASGVYTYTLNFSLSGYDASTAAFTAHLAADNAVSVKLNGSDLYSAEGFNSWHDFGASSGFVAGQNTLVFEVTNYVQNGGNPTGLRVEFLTSSVTAVPEPATYGMLLGGLALVGAIARRRKQQ